MALHELEVLPDASAAAKRFATLLATRLREVAAERGGVTAALSGGSGPWEAFRLLAGEDVPWETVELFQVDERVAPHGEDQRNLTHLEESLPPDAWPRMRAMPSGPRRCTDAGVARRRTSRTSTTTLSSPRPRPAEKAARSPRPRTRTSTVGAAEGRDGTPAARQSGWSRPSSESSRIRG